MKVVNQFKMQLSAKSLNESFARVAVGAFISQLDPLLEEISDKIENDKKPDIVKAALDGMKSFLISTGAEATTALMEAAMQGLF